MVRRFRFHLEHPDLAALSDDELREGLALHLRESHRLDADGASLAALNRLHVEATTKQVAKAEEWAREHGIEELVPGSLEAGQWAEEANAAAELRKRLRAESKAILKQQKAEREQKDNDPELGRLRGEHRQWQKSQQQERARQARRMPEAREIPGGAPSLGKRHS